MLTHMTQTHGLSFKNCDTPPLMRAQQIMKALLKKSIAMLGDALFKKKKQYSCWPIYQALFCHAKVFWRPFSQPTRANTYLTLNFDWQGF